MEACETSYCVQHNLSFLIYYFDLSASVTVFIKKNFDSRHYLGKLELQEEVLPPLRRPWLKTLCISRMP